MKYFTIVAVLLVAVLAVVSAQYPRYRRPVRIVRPIPLPNKGDRYAASLGGAQVGTYGKSRDYVNNRGGGYFSGSEVHGESLGNAKVGLYGNDRARPVWG
ncbi:hypothetical protein JTE90_015064 [Oedothorax gibbosus]|uniref:Uncharacterized protein n=1 Tax=Oedothorax gibbosus TaxID=931172 RepID=A0AAV6VQE8_9ARAC|nr:hypothetical protein JTE90_015064 [Oedothorax gibbosus]